MILPFSLSLQLVWLVRELVKSGVIGADGVLMTLMKQIAGQSIHHVYCWFHCFEQRLVSPFLSRLNCVKTKWLPHLWSLVSVLVCLIEHLWLFFLCPGGDITSKNLWLAENVLDILLDQRCVGERSTGNTLSLHYCHAIKVKLVHKAKKTYHTQLLLFKYVMLCSRLTIHEKGLPIKTTKISYFC